MKAELFAFSVVWLVMCTIATSTTLGDEDLRRTAIEHNEGLTARQTTASISVNWHGFVKSRYRKNSNNTRKYVFNDSFFFSKQINNTYTESDVAILFLLKNRLAMLKEQADNGTLTLLDKFEWQPMADALVADFRNETGAVAYDGRTKKWIVCGWVSLVTTFVGSHKMTRLCASCASVGLESPERAPELGRDFGWSPLEDDVDDSGTGAESKSPIETPEMDYNLWSKWSNEDQNVMAALRNTATGEYQTIDLFTSTEESCASDEMDGSCASFCCTSVYRTSEFCEGSDGYCF